MTVVLLGSDSDEAPTYTIDRAPSHGALSSIDQAAGTVTDTPDVGDAGLDSFTYEASDSQGTSDVATVAITVAPLTPPTLLVAQPKRMRANVSRITRHGRTVTLDVAITAGRGTVTATAVAGRRHVSLHSKRKGSRIVFTDKLAAGRWTVHVKFKAALGVQGAQRGAPDCERLPAVDHPQPGVDHLHLQLAACPQHPVSVRGPL